jgi:putative ABC transport system permease protein
MSPLTIAWRNLTTRPVQTALTALIVALGAGLAVAVIALAGGTRRGLIEAGGPFELVIGPKGSATQLVNSSVLLQDLPIGNFPYARYQAIAADPRVLAAVPIGLGDNIQGLRLVGTTPAFFLVTKASGQPFYRLARGHPFDQASTAVLGSAAADRLGLGVGATLVSTHGVMATFEEAAHDATPYTVVGVLASTNTPADLGIYVPLESVWEVHGLHGHDEAHADAHADADDPGVTAVLVRARDISAAYQLYQELNAAPDVQAALPGAVLTQYLTLLGQGQQVLSLVAGVALVMAGLSVALTLYGAVLARQREIAVLRALGASRRTVLGVALLESLALGGVGLAAGGLLGYVAAAIIAARVRWDSAVAVQLAPEPSLIGVTLVLLSIGLVAGLAPALRAYRVEAAAVLAQ